MGSNIKLYREGDLGFLTLNNKPVNALSSHLLDEMVENLNSIKHNQEISALIIKSDLKNFCAGADLKERVKMDDNKTLEIVNKINDCFDLIESLDCITIALMNGYALGGGAELGLCCDFRVGSFSTKIGFPETSIGIIPGAGGTYRLPSLIGESKAKYWILSARKFSAEEAFQDGYLDFISDDDELLESAIDLAQEILNNSNSAIKLAKRAMRYNNSERSVFRLGELRFYKKTLRLKDRINYLNSINKKNL